MDLSQLALIDDILPDFVSRPLPVRVADAMPGADRATLVHHRELLPDAHRAILYLPGYSDYFFQSQHARDWRERGFEFFALDMRAQGRNLLPDPDAPNGPLPEYVPDLRIRHEEIALAMDTLRRRYDKIAVLGHSTGGLQAVMYTYRYTPVAHPSVRAERGGALRYRTPHRLAPDALILNSPWFDLNENVAKRTLGTSLISAVARVEPRQIISGLDPAYTEDLVAQESGRWNIDVRIKPIDGFPMRAATFTSIRAAHRRLARGLNLDVATLICHSARSGANSKPTPQEVATSDVVLNVKDMVRLATAVSINAQTYAIEGGKHDLALSAPAARETYLRRITDFAELTLY